MPDHEHLVIEANPFDSPTKVSLRIFKKFPTITSTIMAGVLWSSSYYVGAAGHISAEVI
jgi:REP element-mobilizing transposase RayT